MSVGPIEMFMVADHVRLDRLLARAMATDPVDADAFEEFREGLLRHIGMEEKVLGPLLRERVGDWPPAAGLRRDHGQLAKLLVPTPTKDGCAAICELLARHNPLEEGPAGLYARCDAAAQVDGAAVVARLAAQPRVPLAAHYDGPLIKKRS